MASYSLYAVVTLRSVTTEGRMDSVHSPTRVWKVVHSRCLQLSSMLMRAVWKRGFWIFFYYFLTLSIVTYVKFFVLENSRGI